MPTRVLMTAEHENLESAYRSARHEIDRMDKVVDALVAALEACEHDAGLADNEVSDGDFSGARKTLLGIREVVRAALARAKGE